jgi:hypothetical protein
MIIGPPLKFHDERGILTGPSEVYLGTTLPGNETRSVRLAGPCLSDRTPAATSRSRSALTDRNGKPSSW